MINLRLACGLLMLFSILPAQAAAQGTDVAADLQDYYKTRQPPDRWKRALDELNTGDERERKNAADYLTSLLTQALRDEHSGDGWQATPFWGSSGESLPRRVRETVAKGLKNPSEEMIPLLRWLLYEEQLPGSMFRAVQALVDTGGKQADKLLTEVALTPHDHPGVARIALRELPNRLIPLNEEQLEPLCLHHRTKIRRAARELADKRGLGPLPDFAPVAAMQSPAIKKLMEEFADMMFEMPASNARFVLVTTKTTWEGQAEEHVSQERGWLLSEDQSGFVVLTPHGKRRMFARSAIQDRGLKSESRFAPFPIEDEVKRLAEIRAGGDRDYALSEQGAFSGQFQGRGAGLYEFMIARWLYSAKRFELSARILLPALETLDLDSHAVDIVQSRLGLNYGYRMLVAFVGERDYPAAIAVADTVIKRFPRSPLSGYAHALKAQLPKRSADFKELHLPKPEEWARVKAGLPRRKQIEFLCDRMRLLNGYQYGQPGSVILRIPQTAEPNGLSADAVSPTREGKTEVINPLMELDSLNLNVADIPTLANYLREDWFLLAVGFWRDFHPSRTLERSRPLIATLINDVAKRDLVDSRQIERLDQRELQAEIDRIAAWAKVNANKDEKLLLLDALGDAYESQRPWRDVSRQAERLVELKAKAAIPILSKYLVAENANQFSLADILGCCRRIDPASVVEQANQHIDHASQGVQLEAALILWKTARSRKAGEVIGAVLSEATPQTIIERQLTDAVRALLHDKEPDSRALAATILQNPTVNRASFRDRAQIVGDLTRAGAEAGYDFYLRLLENPDIAEAAETAREVLAEMDPENEELERLWRETDGDPRAAIAAAREWLKKTKRGESPPTC